jgi:hypothetical protein
MVQPFRGLTTRGVLDRSGDLHSEETRKTVTPRLLQLILLHSPVRWKPLADWRGLVWDCFRA